MHINYQCKCKKVLSYSFTKVYISSNSGQDQGTNCSRKQLKTLYNPRKNVELRVRIS